MKNRIMILGASILQLPAILCAKEMGLKVVAVDMDRQAIGFHEADICLDISTNDIPAVVQAAKRYRIDGIMTSASDMPMRTVAAVARELNLPGISEETAYKATNKAAMRESLKEHGVPIPAFYRVADYQDYLEIVRQFKDKLIVKPADNSGSRGVFLVDSDRKDLVEYAYEYSKKYSRSGEILVEEFMEGTEVSVESITVEGETHVLAITDKRTTGAPRFIELGHSQPSRLPIDIQERIEEVAKAAIDAIGIRNGPSHTEIMVTGQGPKIVELGARTAGDNIASHLVPFSTGINMVQCCIHIALGRKPDIEKKYSKGSAIRYFQTKTGRILDIKGVENAEKLPGVRQVSFVKKIGDNVEKLTGSQDRIGFVIAQGKDALSALEVCDRAMDVIEVIIE